MEIGQRPVTPPTQITTTGPDLSTHLTYRTLKRQAEDMEDADAPPSYEQLQKFIKGSLIQAAENTVTKDELAHTRTGKMARTTRQQPNRRQGQNGGVMYASEARAITEKRRKEEEQRLKRAQEKGARQAAKTAAILAKREKQQAKKAEQAAKQAATAVAKEECAQAKRAK